MNQLGLLPGSSIFGDDPSPTKDQFKTGGGALKAKSQKAIDWYMKEHNLSLLATGVYPMISFRIEDGTEQPVHIEEIVSDYNDHKARSKRSGREN